MRYYSVLYSYATWDRFYRGQRGVRVRAASPLDAIRKIRTTSVMGYSPTPSAQIVECKVSTNQKES